MSLNLEKVEKKETVSIQFNSVHLPIWPSSNSHDCYGGEVVNNSPAMKSTLWKGLSALVLVEKYRPKVWNASYEIMQQSSWHVDAWTFFIVEALLIREFISKVV